jgi:branched-chain amino acid transport system permease protein
MGVGAYTTGALMGRLGFSFWLTIPIAALAAALIGLLWGAPALKAKGFYLAITTLGAHVVLGWAFLRMVTITGGPHGLRIPPATLGNVSFLYGESLYYLTMVSMIVCVFLAHNLARTQVGRAFRAIAYNESVALAMGINTYVYKLLAFMLASAFAGIAGAFYAVYMGHVSPEHFSLLESIWILGAIVIGGLGTVAGALIGGLVILGLKECASILAPVLSAAFPVIGNTFYAASAQALFGLMVILVLIFQPRGLSYALEPLKRWYLEGKEGETIGH